MAPLRQRFRPNLPLRARRRGGPRGRRSTDGRCGQAPESDGRAEGHGGVQRAPERRGEGDGAPNRLSSLSFDLFRIAARRGTARRVAATGRAATALAATARTPAAITARARAAAPVTAAALRAAAVHSRQREHV